MSLNMLTKTWATPGEIAAAWITFQNGGVIWPVIRRVNSMVWRPRSA